MTTTKRVQYVLFLTVAIVVVLYGGTTLDASARLGWCDDWQTCGPDKECDTPCQIGSPAFEITCGEYGGDPIDPIRGNCLGTCGDTWCNDLNDEDAYTCYDDCGECGDDICTEIPENRPWGYCCEDCNSNPSSCFLFGGGCGPPEGCGEFEDDGVKCNAAGSCCPMNALFDPDIWIYCDPPGQCNPEEAIEIACGQNCNSWEDCLDTGTELWACVTAGSGCLPQRGSERIP